MSNQTKSTKEIIILNGVETAMYTNYILKKGALGDYCWHYDGVTLERLTPEVDPRDKEYKVSNKKSVYINSVSATTFDVYTLENGAWILSGSGYVKSSGIARDKRCLTAYLTGNY